MTKMILFFILLLVIPTHANTILLPSQDTYTDRTHPTSNFSRLRVLHLKEGANAETQGFIKFDLSPIPTDTLLDDIFVMNLKLFPSEVTQGGTIEVYLVGSAWAEDTLNYNNKPQIINELMGSIPITRSDTSLHVNIDLTQAMALWLVDRRLNYGLMLKPTNGLDMFIRTKEITGSTVLSSLAAGLEFKMVGETSIKDKAQDSVIIDNATKNIDQDTAIKANTTKSTNQDTLINSLDDLDTVEIYSVKKILYDIYKTADSTPVPAVRIRGKNLFEGAAGENLPVIRFGNWLVSKLVCTQEPGYKQVIAILPPNQESGTYLLRFTNILGKANHTITLGAVGATGATGAMGAPGADGTIDRDQINAFNRAIAKNKSMNVDQNLAIAELETMQGVFVNTTVDHPISQYTNTVLRWNGEEYDSDNMHSPAVNPSRLTVPAGASYVRLTASTIWAVDGQLEKHKEMRLMKNGELSFPFAVSDYATGKTAKKSHFSSASIPVTSGDYFELSVYHAANRSGSIVNGDCTGPCIIPDSETWFSMEIVK